MQRDFPHVSAGDLGRLDVELPALAATEIALTGGHGGKLHTPYPDANRYSPGACRHSRPASTATTYRLIEVLGEICSRCAIVLPRAYDALWRATGLASSRRTALDRSQADGTRHTWLGYARHSARRVPAEDEQFQRWLQAAAADPALAEDTTALASAWTKLALDYQTFLDEYASTCPQVEAYNAARDAVERSCGSAERQELDQVTAAVGGVSRHPARASDPTPRLDVWSLVSGEWMAARSRGCTSGPAAEAAHRAAAYELGRARVVDVTRLPLPSRTPGAQYPSPAAWADAELAHWWPEAVSAATARLEAEFEAQLPDTATRLLLVRDWPPTRNRDEDVAYLAAFPVVGPLVPHGHRSRDIYPWNGGPATEPSFTAVVMTPAHLATTLAEAEEDDGLYYEPRFIAGGPATGGDADLAAARALLRQAFPFFPGDADNEPRTPSPEVEAERSARLAARVPEWAGEGDERPYTLADELRNGNRTWIPSTPEDVRTLEALVPRLRDSLIRIDLLSGSEHETKDWASLIGTIASVDSTAIHLRPGGHHDPLRIPLHRVVALTGEPDWERSQPSPRPWQSYEPYGA